MGDVKEAIHLNRLLRLYPSGAEGGERWELEANPRDKFAMHGVLSGVACCEGKHPTPGAWIDPCNYEVVLYSAFSVVSVPEFAQTVL